MKSRRNIQYTIRNIPSEVDHHLRDVARRMHQSLNRTLLIFLSRAAGVTEVPSHHDLDSFFGSWIADPEVDRALAEQRAIDPSLWQ